MKGAMQQAEEGMGGFVRWRRRRTCIFFAQHMFFDTPA